MCGIAKYVIDMAQMANMHAEAGDREKYDWCAREFSAAGGRVYGCGLASYRCADGSLSLSQEAAIASYGSACT